MLPVLDIPGPELAPIKTPYTWRGAPVYVIKYSTTGTLVDSTVIYTFPHPAVVAPDTRVCFRVIHVVGWLGRGGGTGSGVNRYVCAQMQNTTSSTTTGSMGWQINNSGQLKFRNQGTSDPTGAQLYIYYTRCRQ